MHSLTGTESFASRLLASERWRVGLMLSALALILSTILIRRMLGGVTMSVDAVFIPTVIVLLAGMGYQLVALMMVARRARRGGSIPTWQRAISVAADLAVPGAALMILQHNSPRGAYAALSAPALLLMPLIILLSILRLRPWFSFWTGVGAAAIHAALVSHAVTTAGIDADHLPLLYTYGLLLLVSGLAAAVVSWRARRYVIEAVEEATVAERAQHAVAVIEQDLRVARDIQMGLLPSERPTIAGFAVAGMARPAAQAGGDYYDWQPLSDGRLVVVVADVTGHGIGPALVMAVCRAYARASTASAPDPETLLARLNDLIIQDVKGARFITMALAVVSADGAVDLISAGHGPTLFFDASSNRVESFGGDGLPLGVMDSESYGPRRTLRLDVGDILVMLTDGFMEHARATDSQQFGTDRLEKALRDSASRNSAEIISALDRAVSEFAQGAPQNDDMTAVVIKRVAETL